MDRDITFTMLEDAFDGCFLCSPEPWRVIAESDSVRLIAGAGPICPGYVVLAPKEHVPSVAQLPGPILAEFLSLFAHTKSTFESQYGPGYTAYEHGRIGSCRLAEMKGDQRTYCFHAHRVLIPQATLCSGVLPNSFKTTCPLDTDIAISNIAEPYVFYETGQGTAVTRIALLHEKGIPSQFMRRTIVQHLKTGRDWNWANDVNIPEMLETVSALRPHFQDVYSTVRSTSPQISLPTSVSVDGLSHVGKTTIGSIVARLAGRPLIDTGLYFRWAALAQLEQRKTAPAEIAAHLLEAPPPQVHAPHVAQLAAILASQSPVRQQFRQEVLELANRLHPCVMTGRDAWTFLPEQCRRFLVTASLSTRIWRRIKESAKTGILETPQQVAADLAVIDSRDRPKLPPEDAPGILTVQNSGRPVDATVREFLWKVTDEY